METIIQPSRRAADQALKKFMSRVKELGLPESVLKIDQPVLDYLESLSTIRTTLDFGGDRYCLEVDFAYEWHNDTINAKGRWRASPNGIVHEIELASQPDFVEGIQHALGEAIGDVFTRMARETGDETTQVWSEYWWRGMPN